MNSTQKKKKKMPECNSSTHILPLSSSSFMCLIQLCPICKEYFTLISHFFHFNNSFTVKREEWGEYNKLKTLKFDFQRATYNPEIIAKPSEQHSMDGGTGTIRKQLAAAFKGTYQPVMLLKSISQV